MGFCARTRRRSAAEQAAQEAAAAGAGGLPILRLRLQLGDLRLQFLQFLVGGAERLLLHDHCLGQQIGGIGLCAHAVGDEGFGVAVARRIGLAAHAFE